MLQFTPNKTKNNAKAELTRRIQGLTDWQARLVLAFIEKLFYQDDQAAAEMEAVA